MILGKVIETLDLNRRWGKRYGGGAALKAAETLSLLKARIDLRPVRNTSLIQIRVFGETADEPARIANEIAKVYQNRYKNPESSGSTPSALQVEIVDRATPGLRPVRPNKPVNLAIAALAGLLLGVATGAGRAAQLASKKRG